MITDSGFNHYSTKKSSEIVRKQRALFSAVTDAPGVRQWPTVCRYICSSSRTTV